MQVLSDVSRFSLTNRIVPIGFVAQIRGRSTSMTWHVFVFVVTTCALDTLCDVCVLQLFVRVFAEGC